MRIAVVACDMIRRELEPLLASDPDITEVVWLEAALHVHPQKMKAAIVERIREVAADADVVFLGYGFCQSLQGIEDELDVPVVLPQHDDCIALLIGPERYRAEVADEVGTWFMTPGWAEVGAEMVIKELHLDRARRYGKDPMEMAKRLFTHYRRGLYIHTGTREAEPFREKARAFCADFSLRYEEGEPADCSLLAEELERAKTLARRLERSGGTGQ